VDCPSSGWNRAIDEQHPNSLQKGSQAVPIFPLSQADSVDPTLLILRNHMPELVAFCINVLFTLSHMRGDKGHVFYDF